MSNGTSDLRDIERRAISASSDVVEERFSNGDLASAIRSAELYMQALRLADNTTDRRRLDQKTQEALALAEVIKGRRDRHVPQSSRSGKTSRGQSAGLSKLSKREQIIILEGSRLNGSTFRPWDAAPLNEEFEVSSTGILFTEDRDLSLSSEQLESFAGWERPRGALSRVLSNHNGYKQPQEPTMVRSDKVDLVQDITSDCSVIASFCACTARADRGHQKILCSMMHPYDYFNEHPKLSANGKYVFKLFFNGCWRRVEIDDRLPASKTSRILHVIDRRHPELLWPALVEKAYLKVRGGYDFAGSNSATDVAVLTGWIPQQLFLHDEEIEPEKLCREIYDAFQRGNVLLTIGTGRISKEEQEQTGLAAEHDYAILDLKEQHGLKEVLIKNPWARGDVWRGARKRKPQPNHEDTSMGTTDLATTVDVEDLLPGSFWMDFDSVFHHFENLYLNWEPKTFRYKTECHFSWQISHSSPRNLFVDNPQYSVSVSGDGEVWLLLNRHFKTGDYTLKNCGKDGHISLYLFSNGGQKVMTSEGAAVRGPYVDSPNTLMRFHAKSDVLYTAVVASQDLLEGKHNFTLTAFAQCPLRLSEAPSQYRHKISVNSSWTRSSAGGNADSPHYLLNPQFSISTKLEQKVAFVLQVVDEPPRTAQDAYVKILVLFSDGRRITRLRPRDAVAHSGGYRRECSAVETVLPAGKHTIICSTFEQGQLGQFLLDFYTTAEDIPALLALPSERSGRLSMVTEPAVFATEITHIRAMLFIPKSTRVLCIARSAPGISARSQSNSLLLKMTVERGRGPDRTCVATSAQSDEMEFGNVADAVRVEDMHLEATTRGGRGGGDGLWLVLERLVQSAVFEEYPAVQVEVLSEESIQLGKWLAD